MQYFWKQYSDLPEGLGYGRFSAPHIITLAVIAALVVIAVMCFRRQDRQTQERILIVIPWLMLLLEAAKQIFLLWSGHFGVGYLPLHLCGLGTFVFLAESCSRTERWQTVFSEIAVTLIMPGSVAALLFPDWTHLYPVLNYMNLHSFLWHGLLLLYLATLSSLLRTASFGLSSFPQERIHNSFPFAGLGLWV